MNRVLAVFLLLTISATCTRGQSTNRSARAIVSPEVSSDRTVTFHVRAPNAREVTVNGEWPNGTKAMEKDADGVWSATVGPLPPDFYGYGFSLDGFRTLDPANSRVKPARSPNTSILDIPATPPGAQDYRDVPHGTVRSHTYQSKSLNKLRNLTVYTPPGYEENARQTYPTLFLLHGSGDNEATWVALGRAHMIADNLLAEGKARAMIIVMTDGHAYVAPPGPSDPQNRGKAMQAFQDDLLKEVMPFMEKNYRVRKGADQRAIVGLSMGGGQSLTVGLNHTHLFHWVGGFSAAVFNPEQSIAPALNDPKAINKNLKLLWFACGKDDRLVENGKQLSTLLESKGIKHQFVTTEGNHSWPVWRKYLIEFMPMLFTFGR